MTHILLEKKDHVAIATVNRPKALNALNSEVLNDLNTLLDEIAADPEIRVLVLTGSGEKAFVAGADIGEMSTLTKAEGEAFGKKGNDVFRKLETLPIPSIAARSTLMSLTSGRFSTSTVSSVMMEAARMPSAAFFAPLMSTSPTRGLPPLMIY